jgi:hypothetical protein
VTEPCGTLASEHVLDGDFDIAPVQQLEETQKESRPSMQSMRDPDGLRVEQYLPKGIEDVIDLVS